MWGTVQIWIRTEALPSAEIFCAQNFVRGEIYRGKIIRLRNPTGGTYIHAVLLLVDPVLVEAPAPRRHSQRLLFQHQQMVAEADNKNSEQTKGDKVSGEIPREKT